LNVPGIVGLGEAAALARGMMTADAERLTALRDRLHGELVRRLDDVGLNGHPSERLPNTVNLRFEGAEADAVMVRMPEVAVSSGSACTSAVPALLMCWWRLGSTIMRLMRASGSALGGRPAIQTLTRPSVRWFVLSGPSALQPTQRLAP
jgi:hypothetical protein